MRLSRGIFSLLSPVLIGGPVFLVCGCGSVTPNALSAKPSAQTIDQGQTVDIAVTQARNPASLNIRYSLSGVGTVKASNDGVTYVAPTDTVLSQPVQVTVTITSATDSAQSVSVPITVNPYLQLPWQTLQTGTVGQIIARPCK